ncbi:MAG: ABC transporter ATP-binding protein [Alphaproteobacteria bacterium]
MGDVIRVRDLRVQFTVPEGVITAVDGVSFRVPEGGAVALVGESGAGKSVVAQSIMGILPRVARVAGGEILFADPDRTGPPIDIAGLDPDGRDMRAIRGRRISIIFQEPMTSLSPLHTVGNQIGEALRLHRDVTNKAGRALTAAMLRLVGFPDPVAGLDAYPFELSGGLRQRAMIAMALICRPALLIADEPTTALDVTIQAQILKLIKDLQRELDMAVLIITHDLGVVANIAEEIVVMYHGRVMEAGTIEDIFRRPEHPYLEALLHAVPRFDMKPGERLVPIRDIRPGKATMLRRKMSCPEDADGAGPLLSLRGVSKSFVGRKSGWFGADTATRHTAVDDVSLDIARGECLGLVGESGCGKTTLSKIILRALTPDAGTITYNSRGKPDDVLALAGDALLDYRRRVQFIFQDPFGSLNPRMTVFDIIGEPLTIHRIGTREERAETIKELMRLVGLDVRCLRRYPHSFSGGQRQRIGIARALALGPELLICDEPVSALDVSIQAQILNLLKDLKSELGLTYLFVSHNLAVVDYVADRVAVMCSGRLVEVAARDALFHDARHPYTKALLAAVPEPDPDKPLDFDLLATDRASEPTTWPAPFTLTPELNGTLTDIGDGHLVRVSDTDAALKAAS